MPGFERDGGGGVRLLPYATTLHPYGNTFGTVRRLLGCFRHFRLVVVIMMMAMFVVECLQGEAAMCLLASSSALRDVGVVFAHCFRLVDL